MQIHNAEIYSGISVITLLLLCPPHLMFGYIHIPFILFVLQNPLEVFLPRQVSDMPKNETILGGGRKGSHFFSSKKKKKGEKYRCLLCLLKTGI